MVALCLAFGGLREKLGHSENCEPLPIRGPGRTRPPGKDEKSLRWMHLTAKVKSVYEQGVEEDVVTSVYPEPQNHGRIASSSIMSADVLIRHDLILPEETTRSRLPMGSQRESPGAGRGRKGFRLSPRKRHPSSSHGEAVLGRSEASSAPRGRTRISES
ncbi:hypothetical protein Q5P01_000576 [Channa striata]|uniref:Uncharacterized protein n=1 Tax=Channa striata TaxID=64152 RepID=A0AA88IXN4_CHASR|nr:hypothetical protein Q5P01_000576 [Channa striata]